MDEKIVQEILHEIFSSFETLETQSSAILQFMKAKGLANDEELAPFLEQAGNASSVRWLAARVRIEHLISGAMNAAENAEKKKPSKPEEANAGEGSEAKQSSASDGDQQQGDRKQGDHHQKQSEKETQGKKAHGAGPANASDKTEAGGSTQDHARDNSRDNSEDAPERSGKTQETTKPPAKDAA